MRRAPIKELPSVDELKALFSYNETTGILSWNRLTTRGAHWLSGKVAGTTTARGYITIGIRSNGKLRYFLAHRIIWKMMTGADPESQVDHRDGDRKNNRWLNLRAATNGENIQNAKLRCDNSSGTKGVSWDAGHKAWKAVITCNGDTIRLGRFKTKLEAAHAVLSARRSRHGEFARAL
jgi:hypothetical protein